MRFNKCNILTNDKLMLCSANYEKSCDASQVYFLNLFVALTTLAKTWLIVIVLCTALPTLIKHDGYFSIIQYCDGKLT